MISRVFFKFLFISLFFMVSSCAFTPHIDKRAYKTATPVGNTVNKKSIALMVSGEDSNVVGHIRNGFGTETANIEVPQKKKDLILSALEQEFSSAGYEIKPSSPNKLLARIKQVEVELAQEDGKAGYYAICDLQAYLIDKNKMVEKNFVENDKIESFWVVTASEGIDAFYRAINKCSEKIVADVSKRMNK